MGVTNAGFSALFSLPVVLASPATDDPIVLISVVMGISGAAMLICIGLTLADRIKKARMQKKSAEKQKKG